MLEIDVATKEPQVIAALCHLEDFLGEDSVVLMDYWDGDRLAVGVANPAIHGVLAHIASVAWGSYEIHIECLPPPDSDPSFNTIAILRQCNELALMGQIVGSALQVSNDCPCIVDLVAAWLLPDAANVRHYPAVIERGVSGFGVFFPDILGCTSFGDTVAQAACNAKIALRGHLELAIGYGELLSEPSNLNALYVDADIDEVARTLIRAA